MSVHEANNLILEHLRQYGYQLEARILEKEFTSKDPKHTHDNSKLMDFLRKAMGNRDDKKSAQVLNGTLRSNSNRSTSLKNRSNTSKLNLFQRTPPRASDHVYQHIIRHPALPKELTEESDTNPSLPYIGPMSKERANNSFGADNSYSQSYYHNNSYHNFYDNSPYPDKLDIARKAVKDPYPHTNNAQVTVEPYYRHPKRTAYNKSIQPPRHLYANKQPLSYKPERFSKTPTRTPTRSPHQNSSLSVLAPSENNMEYENINKAEKFSHGSLMKRHQSVPKERSGITEKWKPVTGYTKAPTAFGSRGKSTFTQNYNAFISNPQRGENGPVYVGDKSQTNYRSHVSLVHDFLVNEKKEVSFNDKINEKPPRFMVQDHTENSNTALRRYNDRISLNGRVQYNFGHSPVKVDFTQDSSQFGRNGEPLNKRENNVHGDGSYVPVVKRANVRMDPKIFEFLLTNTFFSESEIRSLFEVHISLVYNPTQAMNKKIFKIFISQTKNVNGEHFTDCLFHFGPQLSLMASNNGIIEFQEAVVILDRLNQENPFSLMHFIFRLTVGDGEKRASLSLVETILREIKPANMKGRVGLLLDSLEFIYTHEGQGRSGHMSFEDYLEIMKRFEPLRKFC